LDVEGCDRPSRHPGSFRDPASYVVVQGDRVFRVFVGAGAPAFETVRASGLLSRLAADGLLLPADPVDPVLAGDLAPSDDAIVVEQMRVPVVSYPYEWPFEMLRRAALLQLEILERALASGFILKDATPYNIQFLGTRPVFVDLGSFLPYVDGQPWDAYAQFCRTSALARVGHRRRLPTVATKLARRHTARRSRAAATVAPPAQADRVHRRAAAGISSAALLGYSP
jgi:hypothetical protein